MTDGGFWPPTPSATDDGWGFRFNRTPPVKGKKTDFCPQWRGEEGQSGHTFPPQRPRNSTSTRGDGRLQGVNLDFQRRAMNVVYYESMKRLLTSSLSLGVPVLVYSFSLHRHSYIGFILAFASSIHNKLLFYPVCERRVNLLVCSLPLHRHLWELKEFADRQVWSDQWKKRWLWKARGDACYRNSGPHDLHLITYPGPLLWSLLWSLLWIDEVKANIKPIYECRCNERL
jgi:hypothetical protein